MGRSEQALTRVKKSLAYGTAKMQSLCDSAPAQAKSKVTQRATKIGTSVSICSRSMDAARMWASASEQDRY